MSDFLLNINQALNNQDDVPVSMLNSQELQIDDEFAALIPPLTTDEFTLLEQSIVAEGCREAIITWGNIIVDGHNRYSICKRHGITYTTQQMNFPYRNTVMFWMLQNQLARRNLNDFQRIEMVRKCEQALKAQAKERQGRLLISWDKTGDWTSEVCKFCLLATRGMVQRVKRRFAVNYTHYEG